MLSEASSQEDGEGLPPLCGLSSATNRLRLYLPTLDPAQQPRPGEDLRQGERQGEVVGDIVIATGTTLLFETPPLQQTHAPLTQDMGSSTALVQPSPGRDGDGGRPLVLPRSPCRRHSWCVDQALLRTNCSSLVRIPSSEHT